MGIKNLDGKSAIDLFPDLVRDTPKKKKPTVFVPPPPDISWLIEGMETTDASQSDDILPALVIIASDIERLTAEKILTRMGYTVETAPSYAQAIQKLQTLDYKVIICRMEAEFKDIHHYICSLPPFRRRLTYYAIVGPDLHTLYDIEALALSANIVINDDDLQYLENILTKGFRDYENLFRPLLDILGARSSSS